MPIMKIIETTIYQFKIPMIPFTIATGTMEFAQNVLIQIKQTKALLVLENVQPFQ